MIRKVYTSKDSFCLQNENLPNPLLYTDDLKILGQHINICGRTAPNRLVCQAMEGCDGTATGEPDTLTRRRYLRLARGGAGIIWFEATACREDGRANPRQLWIRPDNVDAFRTLLNEIRAEAIAANGVAPLIIMQNTHSGRYSKPHGLPAPMVARHNPYFEQNKPLDENCVVSDDVLDEIKEDLIRGAALAVQAGFDGVDIKCCHGYLNSELLSAFTRENSRYGGSFENRTRLLRECIAAALARCPKDFIVTTRLNAYDGFAYPYGWGVKQDGSLDPDFTEPKKLLHLLADMGVKLVDITMGNPYQNPHVNRPFSTGGYHHHEHPLQGVARMLHGTAELQKAEPRIAIIASGFSYLGAVAPNVAAAFISNGGFAMAGFGRLIFANPDFANQIINHEQLNPAKSCICCSKCTELMRNGSTPGCVIRDSLYTDLYKQVFKNKEI